MNPVSVLWLGASFQRIVGKSCASLLLFIGITCLQPYLRAASGEDPLDTWRPRLQARSLIRGMVYGDGLFVARDYGSTNVYLSRNGAHWTAHGIISGQFTPYGAAYGNGRFVMCGAEGSIAVSTNGLDWEYSRPDLFVRGWDILFAEGRFVAAGFARVRPGGIDSAILSSSDGLNWTQRLFLTNAELRGITYGDGVYVASGPCNSNVGSNSCITSVTSTNLIQWERDFGAPGDAPGYNYNLAFGNGVFIAAGSGVHVGAIVRTGSVPAIRWTRVVEGNLWNATSFKAAFHDGVFVVGGDNLLLATSRDGTNWTRHTTPIQSGVFATAYADGRLVAAGGNILQSEAIIPGPPLFITGPGDKLLRNGAGYTNHVSVEGNITSLQWQVNGINLPGATNATLTRSNITPSLAGNHAVVATSPHGAATSTVAHIIVADPSVIRQPPLGQSLPAGGTTTLSVQADGTAPISYRWRKNGQTILQRFSASSTDFIVISNVTADAYYEVVVSNIVRYPGELSQRAQITVLNDADSDGMPDDFETANQLDPHNASDAQIDSDGDGISNADEYRAGTNPRDANSFLRIERVSTVAGARVHFNTVAGKTYTLQYTDSLSAPQWKRLTDIVASAAGGATAVADPNAGDTRFYRIVTPRAE